MARKTLPMDVIRTNILPRLPAKTLMRFKCVCKFFLTLISSPEFINLHLIKYHSSSEHNRILFVSGNDSRLYSFNCNSLQSTPVQFTLVRKFFKPIKDSAIEVIGSCKGLLCLASIPNDFRVSSSISLILLNPFTRNYREIPFHYLPSKIGSLGLGFGFDDFNQNYKLVSVTECYGSSCRLYTVVYSFASNSWKFIHHNITSRDYMDSKSWSVVMTNHLLHWLFFGDDGFRIGCFDLNSDQWISDVPSPEPCNDGSSFGYFGYIPVCLRKLDDGCLCFGDFRVPDKFVELWVMKEYGVQDSWSLYRISTSIFPKNVIKKNDGPIDPIALNGNIILLKQRNASSNLMFMYSIKSKLVVPVRIQGLAPFLQAYECKESLAMIPTSARIGPVKTMGFNELPEHVVTLPPYLF